MGKSILPENDVKGDKMKKLRFLVLLTLAICLFITVLAIPAAAAVPPAAISMSDFFTQYKELIDGVKIFTMLALVIVNFGTGVAVSLKTGKFNLKEMGSFLGTRVAPFIISYLAVGVIGVIDHTWAWTVPAVWAIILATLTGAILQNLKELGVPIPSILSGGKTP